MGARLAEDAVGILAGKGAVVTGGSRGIGRAIVRRLAADGASVVFSYRADEAAADEVVAGVRAAGGQARAVQGDQGELDELKRLFDEADAYLGNLDILVNNAAAITRVSVIDTTEADYDRAMAVNTKAVFFAIQWAAGRLRDNGRIISISTLNTVVPAPGVALYCASKAAVEQFTAVAARELGGRGITVNTVSPGATDTDALRGSPPSRGIEQTVAFTALQRLGQPDDIAGVVAFLAGPDSRWITGQNLRATGGLYV
jgi:3-oxoacyl-[acyl-carrier protein] reductase